MKKGGEVINIAVGAKMAAGIKEAREFDRQSRLSSATEPTGKLFPEPITAINAAHLDLHPIFAPYKPKRVRKPK